MKTSPLHNIHKNLGARFTEFVGWQMPVQYKGIIEEHLAVRQSCGLFDVSHMGEIEIQGPEATAIIQKLTCNDASKLANGGCQYSAFLTEEGTFIDDIIVNRLAEDHYLICVNASNADKDFEHARGFKTSTTSVTNRSDDYYQIAVQGPQAKAIFKRAYPKVTLPQKYFTFVLSDIPASGSLIARTGYTGEDGFEIYGRPEDAAAVWTALMEQGALPCGLGARDTLRLEAAYPLYGHEIDDRTNPFKAGLHWIVKMEKGDFVGREALSHLDSKHPSKKLVGILMKEPGIARQGCKIFNGEKEIGVITSGTKSPSLDRAIALGYVRNEFAAVGTKIDIDIHNKKREAEIVPLPFYRKKSH